jgi:hypothetical protein
MCVQANTKSVVVAGITQLMWVVMPSTLSYAVVVSAIFSEAVNLAYLPKQDNKKTVTT